MLRYLHIIGWIWLSCTGPVITWRLTKVYIVSVVICTSKELVNGRRIDNDRNFYFSQSPDHLLTVYQAISWLSVRPSTDCLLDPSVQDQTMTENQYLNFKTLRSWSLDSLKWLSWILTSYSRLSNIPNHCQMDDLFTVGALLCTWSPQKNRCLRRCKKTEAVCYLWC